MYARVRKEEYHSKMRRGPDVNKRRDVCCPREAGGLRLNQRGRQSRAMCWRKAESGLALARRNFRGPALIDIDRSLIPVK